MVKSREEIESLKTKILEILEKPYSLRADFGSVTIVPCYIKEFYSPEITSLRTEYGITDVVEESKHTLLTLACANGYFNTLETFKRAGVNFALCAPNGCTPATAAADAEQQDVIAVLSKLHVNLNASDLLNRTAADIMACWGHAMPIPAH